MRIAALLLAALLVLIGLNVLGQGLNTLDRLTLVERDRDAWQRAPVIIGQLGLHDGSRVVDFGCGAGYFTLKLSRAVGATGTVQAVDILRLPLFFLRIRTLQQHSRNVRIVLGDPGDPRISGPVDAILVVNTWHEVAEPGSILAHFRGALVPHGRLVIADRSPEASPAGHSVDPGLVDAQLRRSGFEIVVRDDRFLVQPDEGPWWLIVTRKVSL